MSEHDLGASLSNVGDLFMEQQFGPGIGLPQKKKPYEAILEALDISGMSFTDAPLVRPVTKSFNQEVLPLRFENVPPAPRTQAKAESPAMRRTTKPAALGIDEVDKSPDEIIVPKRMGVRKNPDGSVSSHLMRKETAAQNIADMQSFMEEGEGSSIDIMGTGKLPLTPPKPKLDVTPLTDTEKARMDSGLKTDISLDLKGPEEFALSPEFFATMPAKKEAAEAKMPDELPFLTKEQRDKMPYYEQIAYARAMAFQKQERKKRQELALIQEGRRLNNQLTRLKIKAALTPESLSAKDILDSRKVAQQTTVKFSPTTPAGARVTQSLIAVHGGKHVYHGSFNMALTALPTQEERDKFMRDVLALNNLESIAPLLRAGGDAALILPMPPGMHAKYLKALDQDLQTGKSIRGRGGPTVIRGKDNTPEYVPKGFTIGKPKSVGAKGNIAEISPSKQHLDVLVKIRKSPTFFVKNKFVDQFDALLGAFIDAADNFNKVDKAFKKKRATAGERTKAIQAMFGPRDRLANFMAGEANILKKLSPKEERDAQARAAKEEKDKKEAAKASEKSLRLRIKTAEQEVRNAETLAITALQNDVTKAENDRAGEQGKILDGIKASGAFTKSDINSVLEVKDGVMTVKDESEYPETANTARRKASLKSLATNIAKKYNAAQSRQLKAAKKALSNAQEKGFGSDKGQQPATKAILGARKKRDALKRSLPPEPEKTKPKTPKPDTTGLVTPPAVGPMQRFIDAAPQRYARYIQTLKDDASLSPEAKARRALRAAKAMNLNIA